MNAITENILIHMKGKEQAHLVWKYLQK